MRRWWLRGLGGAALLPLLAATGACEAERPTPPEPRVARYEANGVRFEYPEDWEEVSLSQVGASAGNELWSVAFGPAETSFVSLTAYQVNVEVDEETVGDVLPEVRSTIERVAEQSGGEVLTAFARTSMGELPGFTVETSARVPEGPRVRSVLVMVFDGTIEYFLNCQFAPGLEQEVRDGCAAVRSSFELTI